jgi:hypothetical protein
MTVAGTSSSFRIPDVLQVRHTPIKDAASGEDKEVRIVYPKGGFFWNEGDICTTAAMMVHYGNVHFEHPGCYACHAEANWTNS